MDNIISKIKKLRITPRVEMLRERVTADSWRQKEWAVKGDENIFDIENVLDQPLVIRKALAFNRMLEIIPADIRPGELIVGDIPLSSVAGGRPAIGYATPEEEAKAAESGLSVRSVWGHVCPDYHEVLALGMPGAITKVESCIKKERDAPTPDTGKIDFFTAGRICCQGAIAYMERYEKIALQKAEGETDVVRRAELQDIAAVCGRLRVNAPQSFYEAVQLFYFVHCAMHANANFSTLGRFDQQLWPYLRADLEQNRTTIEQAQEIIECLWLKLNERTQKNPDLLVNRSTPYDWSTGRDPNLPITFNMYEDTAYFNQWFQTTTLGGRDKAGNNAVNPLSYSCLMASWHVRMTQPIIYSRIGKDTPVDFFNLSCELIRDGMGMPTIVNDDVRIPALTGAGVSIEDANDYAFSGCWETVTTGNCNFKWTPIHALKALELVLHRGVDQITGLKTGIDAGAPDDFTSIGQLSEALKRQIHATMDNAVNAAIRYEGFMYRIAPVPFMSVLTGGCLENGRDITQGGAKYSFHALSLTGAANTADGLVAIDYLVFQKKRFKLSEFIRIQAEDYAGQEELRLEILNKMPKFGNGIDQVDNIAIDIAEDFLDYCKNYSPAPKNSELKFTAMIGTTPMFRLFGLAHGASSDGRKSRTPIADNLDPVDGLAKNGVTAIIESHTKVDFTKVPMGSELNLHLKKSALQSAEGLDRMKALISIFFEKGGSGLNITATDVETLIAAQKEPEKYQDLMVRLGGWQSYFVALDKVHQDVLIARNKY